MESWLTTAGRRDIVVRSLRVALVVGTVLVIINQGGVIAAGEATAGTWVRSALTYLVPYLVSTHASVSAVRSAAQS
ncbi:MAG: nitrate/nitrite transporter NrtS [Pseudomonadota bacterium]